MKERLNIVENKDTVYGSANLLDTETGRPVLSPWADRVSRIRLGKDEYVYYLAFWYKDHDARRTVLLDESGKPVFEETYGDIEIWHDGSLGMTPVILRVRDRTSGLQRLVDLQETPLSGWYESFDEYSRISCQGPQVLRVFRKTAPGTRQVSFLRWPELTPLAKEWFDGECHDRERREKVCGDTDFVSIVKYRGRWRTLRSDGTLDPLTTNK